jgi:hypothetical protein
MMLKLLNLVCLVCFAASVFGISLFAQAEDAQKPLNTLSSDEIAAGWKPLFDGKSTEGWRNYKKDSVNAGWKVVDGALVRSEKGAGDLITKNQYGSFELRIDFKISPEGNSGIIYHVNEDNNSPWQSGPEIQIQDNLAGHDPQKCGWLYQLYPATVDATKPAGEWNTLQILITPEKCVHTMNGVKYCEYVKGSKDWDEKVAASKFSKFKGFGKPTSGFICLQDHSDLVSYRNIYIRELDK